MAFPDGGAAVWAVATRVTPLDANGYPATGSNTFTSNTLAKATLTPVMETGDDIAIKSASGDLAVFAKHGDMIKYYTVALDLTAPDPALEAACAGGTILSDSSVALGTPVAPSGIAGTAGLLAAGTYEYQVSAFNQYGETLASPASATVTTTGSTGSVALTATPITGAVGYRWYGRVAGALQLIGSSATASFVDTGAVTPNGALPSANTTAGPGNYVGYQEGAPGIVNNKNGVSLEFFMRAIVSGAQATYLPYWRIVVPKVANMHITPRDITNANLGTMLEGQAFVNPNWGSGPFADWQFSSTAITQRARCSSEIVPTPGYLPVAATA